MNLETWDASLGISLAVYVILKKSMGWQRADLLVEPSLLVCILREEGVFSAGFCYRGYASFLTLSLPVLLWHCLKHGAGDTLHP